MATPKITKISPTSNILNSVFLPTVNNIGNQSNLFPPLNESTAVSKDVALLQGKTYLLENYRERFNKDFKSHKTLMIVLISFLIIGIILCIIFAVIYYNFNRECNSRPSNGRPFFTCSGEKGEGNQPQWNKPDGTIDEQNELF